MVSLIKFTAGKFQISEEKILSDEPVCRGEPQTDTDSGLRDSSEDFEIKIQSKFPYSNHEFLQTCHFLRSSGGFHNAPPISPSAGRLTKQETSHHFKVIARPPSGGPCGPSSGWGVAKPLLSLPLEQGFKTEDFAMPHLHSCPAENFCSGLEKKKIMKYRLVISCSRKWKKRQGTPRTYITSANIINLIAFLLTNTRNAKTLLLKTLKFKNYYCYCSYCYYYYYPLLSTYFMKGIVVNLAFKNLFSNIFWK